jgi:hypothetical protein
MAEQLANNAASTLTVAIPDAVATSLTVANGTVFPATGNFRIIVDSELMLCTARVGNTLTVTRGIEATTAAAHANGAAVTHVLTKGGLDQYLVDRELAYAEFTANVAAPLVAEASAATVVSAPALSLDGSPILISFFTYLVAPAAATNSAVNLFLFDGATSLGSIGRFVNPASGFFNIPAAGSRRLTPTAASHTYSIRTNAESNAGTVGATAAAPGFIRITRV